MQADGEEKTEQPSEFKLREARKKGHVAKSNDMAAFFALCLSVLFLGCYFPFLYKKWSLFLHDINLAAFKYSEKNIALKANKEAFFLWFVFSVPILLTASLGAILGNLSQFGFLLTNHQIRFDLKKLDPVMGMKKLLSKNRLVEFLKQLAKFAVVMVTIYLAVKDAVWNLILLVRVDLPLSLNFATSLLITILVRVFLCFFLLAVVDFLWQRYSFLKSMRMTKYEVKKEHKQQEGDPLIKQERRRLHHEALEGQSPESVRDAAVVITNPSHLAAAIKFDEAIDVVPTIIAKGSGKLAELIIKEAMLRSVPVIRNVPLARDLQWLEINEEIPKKLYDAVAEVLMFIHELNAKDRGKNTA